MRTAIEGLTTTGATTGMPAPAEAARAQVMALVQQFEGMLLTEMMRGVNESEEDKADEGVLGLGGSSLTDTITAEFGTALSRAGGLGLGEMLGEALARQRGLLPGITGIEPRPGRADAPASEPAAAPPQALRPPVRSGLPEDATVTSDFGWRRDPFSGQTRFHAGADLRAAYGSEVRALVGGTVTFAGDRPGYGLTVVVDHGDGRESLYAHLSSIGVQPGAAVAPGEELARSGNSGRSTGPHLHVEARERGRAVDPRRLSDWAMDGRTTSDVGESTFD